MPTRYCLLISLKNGGAKKGIENSCLSLHLSQYWWHITSLLQKSIIKMLLNQATCLYPNDAQTSSHRAGMTTTNLVAPDSPTFRVFDDDDKIFEEHSLSDLALNVSAPYLPTVPDPASDADDGNGADLSDEDRSLVIARNHLSASSFSNWEFQSTSAS
jgi:hypothetical protein